MFLSATKNRSHCRFCSSFSLSVPYGT